MPARSVMQVVRLSFGGPTACSTCTYTHVYCIVATLSYGPHEIRPHVMTVCCRTCTNIIMIRWSNAREAHIVCVGRKKPARHPVRGVNVSGPVLGQRVASSPFLLRAPTDVSGQTTLWNVSPESIPPRSAKCHFQN